MIGLAAAGCCWLLLAAPCACIYWRSLDGLASCACLPASAGLIHAAAAAACCHPWAREIDYAEFCCTCKRSRGSHHCVPDVNWLYSCKPPRATVSTKHIPKPANHSTPWHPSSPSMLQPRPLPHSPAVLDLTGVRTLSASGLLGSYHTHDPVFCRR